MLFALKQNQKNSAGRVKLPGMDGIAVEKRKKLLKLEPMIEVFSWFGGGKISYLVSKLRQHWRYHVLGENYCMGLV